MCILDYLKDHDGASQRAICEYTLLPRQTVNNVIASFVAHGFVELGDAEGDRRVKTVRWRTARCTAKSSNRRPRSRQWERRRDENDNAE